jgi:hypothetical protein
VVIRALLLLSLAGCGGGSKATESTTPSNTGGSTGSTPPPAGPGEGRVIARTRAGGIVELTGDRTTAMEQAQKEMEAHCGPNNFAIVQEGEEVIGTDAVSGAGTVKTEVAWRVHYQCSGPSSP